MLYVALTRAQDALIITVPLKRTDSALKLPALCAAAEATGPESMRGMGSWAGWLLTAAMLHPGSDALWARTNFLPHHRKTGVPLDIRLLPLPEQTEQSPAPPRRGGPCAGGAAAGQLCLEKPPRRARKGPRQGQRQRGGPRRPPGCAGAPCFSAKKAA